MPSRRLKYRPPVFAGWHGVDDVVGIKIDDVRKVYDPDIVAIDCIAADIADDEFVSVLGPSGCGKSTLLFILGGFLPATEGEVRVGGEVVTEPDPNRGLVFQQSVLYPWLSVEENIEWGLKIQGVPKGERKERVAEFIEMIGLSGFEGAYPGSLSGGMKQRAAMARVLVVNPEILLMDEPFGALDAQTRELMQSELLRIWQQTEQTAVFVTHNIEEALFLSDRVIVLSARPSTVLTIIDVDFDRPREGDLKETQAFIQQRREIWDLIKGDVEIAEQQ